MTKKKPESTQAPDIWSALFDVQSAMGPVLKDAQNTHLRNKYASLEAVWNTVQPHLREVGILATNRTYNTESGDLSVQTVLRHVASETIAHNTVTLPLPKKDAHGIGSAITYGRRYNLALMLCLTQEDDDGHQAVQRPKPERRPEPKKAPANKEVDAEKTLSAFNGLNRFDREVEFEDLIAMLGRPRADFLFEPDDHGKLMRIFKDCMNHEPKDEVLSVDALHADFDKKKLEAEATAAFGGDE